MDLIFIPSILHIDPVGFQEYPYLLRQKIRWMVVKHIGAGHALNPGMVKRNA